MIRKKSLLLTGVSLTGDYDTCHRLLRTRGGSELAVYGDTNLQVFFEAVRDVCGEEGVRAIQDARGGIRVCIPKRVPEGHWLADALGLDQARRVCRSLLVMSADDRTVGLPQILIPLGARAVINRTRTEADRLLINGATVRSVALAIGISERTVHRCRARLIADGKLAAWSGKVAG